VVPIKEPKANIGSLIGTVKVANMTFGEKLKTLCDLEGINLREFSELSSVPYGTIKKYSSGFSTPKVNQIDRMTEQPRFAKYRNMLLSVDDETDAKTEFDLLLNKVIEAGKGEQALEYLRYLAERADK
jgi:transcriptional regulator with XRE-family HTH domain